MLDDPGITFLEEAPSVENYNAMRTAVGWFTYDDPDKLREALAASLHHVTAWKDGRMIGMTRVVGDGRITFYIQDVIVRPEFQGLGVGREMMDRAMAYIRGRTIPNAVIGLMSAKGKEEFYEKFGFIGRPNENLGKGMMQFGK